MPPAKAAQVVIELRDALRRVLAAANWADVHRVATAALKRSDPPFVEKDGSYAVVLSSNNTTTDLNAPPN